MWFSSLTPFSSSYRQEIASSSEAQLKEHASARPEARADNEEQTASPPARDQISVKSQVVATTAGPAKSADQTAVELSDVARRVLEMNKPQDVAQMRPKRRNPSSNN